ncbi:unnamed protein product [Adineta ricciae]|uniref:Uncharacterized protein n=1 Tax=Adineta ricciae TaxID=249248 RepID=A0A816DEW1_ADIRI|nr:unnamed protein product [Adineta ricciae]CAF1636432.1 unnamed protein product [Adineta ricciae]
MMRLNIVGLFIVILVIVSMVSADICGPPSGTCATQGVAGCIERCKICGYTTGYCKTFLLFFPTCKCDI